MDRPEPHPIAPISRQGQHREDDGGARLHRGALLRGLLLDGLLPVAVYYALHLLGASDLVALIAATGVAALRIVGGLLARRELNHFATVMLLVYGVSLVLSLITGDQRVLLLRGSLITGAIGLAFIGTALLGGKPLALTAHQTFRPARATDAARQYDTDPGIRRRYTLTSHVWGFGLLGEAIIRIPLVYLLPISIGFGVSEGMLIVTCALLVGWTLWYSKRYA